MKEMPTSLKKMPVNVIDLSSDDEDSFREKNPLERQFSSPTRRLVLKDECFQNSQDSQVQSMGKHTTKNQSFSRSISHSFDWYLQDTKPGLQHMHQLNAQPLCPANAAIQNRLEKDSQGQANGTDLPVLASLSNQEPSEPQNQNARDNCRFNQALQGSHPLLNRQEENSSLMSILRSSHSGQLLQQIQNTTDPAGPNQRLQVNDQNPSRLEETIPPAISLVPNCSGMLSQKNGFHQFWRAGEYDAHAAPKRSIPGGMDHVRVHPKFLHSNATSHKWAFGAIAELLDNAVDEISNGATYVKVDQIHNPRDNSPAILFQDDGGGMDPECIRRCMSLGYSSKNTNSTIGQYGNGFKTSTMRLGADAIVFSRAPHASSSTQSIGLLSYTFLRKTGQDDIVVPMVDYDLPLDHGIPRTLVRSTRDDWLKNMSTILQWSPYATETELMKQFEDIGPHGTKIVIYNLWLNDDGILELDFDTDKEDIQLRGGAKPVNHMNSQKAFLQSHISYRLRYSLRVYASILYLRKPPNFQIILRGKPVEHHSIADDLKFSKVVTYKPQLGVGAKEVSVATTIGFTKEAPLINVHGFNVYHKNRLIMPFWKVWQDNSSRGRGVVGVLEANFIEPAHDKQDFERTAVLLRLESRLKQMTVDYWKANCELIGYQASSKSRSQNQQNDLPLVQNPHPLSSVVPAVSMPVSAVPVSHVQVQPNVVDSWMLAESRIIPCGNSDIPYIADTLGYEQTQTRSGSIPFDRGPDSRVLAAMGTGCHPVKFSSHDTCYTIQANLNCSAVSTVISTAYSESSTSSRAKLGTNVIPSTPLHLVTNVDVSLLRHSGVGLVDRSCDMGTDTVLTIPEERAVSNLVAVPGLGNLVHDNGLTSGTLDQVPDDTSNIDAISSHLNTAKRKALEAFPCDFEDPKRRRHLEGFPSGMLQDEQIANSGKEMQPDVNDNRSKLVDKLCDENIQLFMRCEQHRQRESELNEMIKKLENELKDARSKFAQLVSNVEAQKKQRLDSLRNVKRTG